MRHFLLHTAFILALLFTWSTNGMCGEANPNQDRYRIHVLVMGPGEDLFARFGHIALEVEDTVAKSRRVYNFGTFAFDDPDLQMKYAKGFLEFWLSVDSYPETIRRYRYFDRQLTERTLAITGEDAAKVARQLEENAKPENRTYSYRHFMDNCCTRVRDVIDKATGGAIATGRTTDITERTFRTYTEKAVSGQWLLGTVIRFSLGPASDKPITRYQEQFLPEVLAEDLDQTVIGNSRAPLVVKKTELVERQGPPVGNEPPRIDKIIGYSFYVLLGMGLLLPLILGNRAIARRLLGLGLAVWGLTAGLGGLVLTAFWAGTTHYDTHYNENLIAYLPTHLWLLGPAFILMFKAKWTPRTLRRTMGYLVVSCALIVLTVPFKFGPLIQDNWGFMAFAATCNTLVLLGLVRTFGQGTRLLQFWRPL